LFTGFLSDLAYDAKLYQSGIAASPQEFLAPQKPKSKEKMQG
jgi:hypothetical protein